MKLFFILALVLVTDSMMACSDVVLPKSEGEPVVSAREMDFNCTMWSNFVCSPRNYKYTGITPNGMDGMVWENKYGFIGVDFLHVKVIKELAKELYCDGMNEVGLSASLLWLDSAMTPKPDKKDYAKVMCQFNIIGWILGRCATVKDVIDAFDKETPDIFVWMFNPVDDFPCPMHVVVHDAENNSVILEWTSDKTFKPAITTGANYTYSMTNDSAQDYRDYLEAVPVLKRLSATDPLNPVSNTFNVGGGSIALPGDSDSSPRWARGYYTMPNATPKAPYACSVPWRVIQAFRSIAHTNIPYGEFYDASDESTIFSPYFFVDWTVIRDHTNKVIYYYSSKNQQMQTVKISDYKEQLEKGKDILELGPLLTSFKDPVPVNADAVVPASPIQKSAPKSLLAPIPEPKTDSSEDLKIFVYAKMKDGTYKFWDGTVWRGQPADGTAYPSLPSSNFKDGYADLWLGLDPDVWKDAEIYSGSGKNFTEMLIEGRCVKLIRN